MSYVGIIRLHVAPFIICVYFMCIMQGDMRYESIYLSIRSFTLKLSPTYSSTTRFPIA